MLLALLRRVVSSIPTLILVASLTFFLLRFAPGGPFDSERVWPEEIQANINRVYGLDLPLHEQFWVWARGAFIGDFKESFQYLGKPVSEIIAESLPASLILGGWALILSLIVGIPLGCLSAWKPRAWIDGIARLVVASGLSFPTYLFASLLILVFSFWLEWLPPALWEGPSSIILPVAVLAFRPMAIVARLTRASMIEALSEDYIRTARGKGLPEVRVVFKHALRNSLIPVISVVGPIAASLVTGSFLVETVFQIPGLGKHFVQAVLNRDYPLVMGVTLVYGVILILANLSVDLLYIVADPRIRLEAE